MFDTRDMSSTQSDGTQSNPFPVEMWLTSPMTFFFGPWQLSRDADVQFTCKLFLRLAILYIFLSLFFSLELETGSTFIIFTFERSIRAEVVTYRLDVVFGSLHAQQPCGFDELRNDEGIIRNRSAKISNTVASHYLPAYSFNFRILRLAPQNGANKNRVF
jgi:hypothetical protein